MNKPLSEWTLGEIKVECKKYSACGPECRIYNPVGDSLCKVRNAPCGWDLSEPPRWTEQDKEDAKVIRHVISCRGLKYGRSAVTGKLYVIWYVSNNVCDIDAITDIGL